MSEDIHTLAEATAADASERSPAPHRALLIVYGGAGERTRLLELPEGVPVVFGRSRQCTVHIDSESVSRRHARIVRKGDAIAVEDLGSRNGTSVNGARISGAETVSIGDEIAVGPMTAVVHVTTRADRRTPVGTTSYLDGRLAAEVDRGLRYRRPLSLIMIAMSGDAEPIDRAVDDLTGDLRPMDVAAEYGPRDLAVLVPEADAHAGAEVAERLAARARAAEGVDVVRVGVASFPTHGTRADELVTKARAALRRAPRGSVFADPPEEPSKDGLVVRDPQMKRALELVRKVAPTSMTVLVTGETGAGKEVLADEVHRLSDRRERPLVRLNCASIPETLLESELFGHEKGAFTGADRQRTGYLEAADGGTLLLDEIGELKPSLQAKLLRVLESQRFMRVGGTREVSVDVRLVCATNRDLEDAVRRGDFREDLYFRISTFAVLVPPLRDRRSEIRPLAEHFLSRSDAPAATLSDAATEVLERYDWPGNVRQLRNAMERAAILQSGGVVEIEDLPDRVRDAERAPPAGPAAVGDGIEMREQIAGVERASIQSALEASSGNQTRAAHKLGISRRSLIYKMEKHGLKPPAPSSRRR